MAYTTTRPSMVTLLALTALLACSVHATSSSDASTGSGTDSIDSSTTDTDDDTATASETVESLFNSAQGIELAGSILAITAIVVGVALVVVGYRFFRAALFTVGFVGGGVGIAMIVENVFADKSWLVLGSWVAFVVGGVLCGSLAMCLLPFGIFAAGAAAGVVLAMLLNNSFGYQLYPDDPQLVLILGCIILGIFCGVLALKLVRPVLILSTSLFGAAVCVWGVGYFAGDFPSSSDLKQYATTDLNGDWVYDIPDAWWAYAAGIVVLFVFGSFMQFRKTARRGGHPHKSYAVRRYPENFETPSSNARYGKTPFRMP